MENGGSLLHLHHERRLPARDVVRRADAREDAVDDRDLRVLRRHERPNLCQQRQQRRLPQIGGLAAHVRTRQDHQLPRCAIEIDVVRHERIRGEALDHRMTGIGGDELVAIMDVRLGEVRDRGRLGEAGEHVERRQRTRGVLDARRFRRHRRAQRLEDRQLALENPLVGAEHLLLVFFQRRRREALAAGNRLLALVIRGRRVQVRLRDLDVVAEDAIETHLQRADAGPLALALLHLRDHLTAGAADRLQLVELGIDAVAREAAVAGEGAGLVDERPLDAIANVGKIIELREQAAEQRRVHALSRADPVGSAVEQQAQTRDRGNRQPQRDEIARAGGAQRHAADEPLDVVHRLQHLAEAAAIGRAEGELLDGVEPIANPLQRTERLQQPAAQHAAAHRGDGAIDLVEQRPLRPALAARDNLEMLQRHRIDEQAFGGRLVGHRAHMREVGLLGVAEIPDQPARGLNRARAAVEAEAVEPMCLQLIEQRPPRGFGLEAPGVRGRDGQLQARDFRQPRRDVRLRRQHDLARPQRRDLVGERLHAVAAVIFRRREFAGGEVEERDAESIVCIHDRHEERRFTRIQIIRVRERAGRDDPDDLALDEPLRLLRILHLLADGNAKPLLHQLREVAIDRVEGNAAHRDAVAARILRSRRERQVERARGHERVLVEHLVEVAHAEKDDRVAVLPLRVEVLTHGRCRCLGCHQPVEE